MTDPITTAKAGVALVSEIMKAAGDNPHVKEAGSNLGKSALTITKAINNALLPLAAVNFAFDKARKYFDEQFAEDFARTASAIPLEDIVEPKASIAGPALQGLAFTHEEPNLKEMYLNLLATAMDGRVSEAAHPAFVEMIKQLDSTEARLLKSILPNGGVFTMCKFRISLSSGPTHHRDTCEHLIAYANKDNSPREYPRATAMMENFIRLGLVAVDYNSNAAPDDHSDPYGWVENRPELARLRAEYGADKITVLRGVMQVTALGGQFAAAVGLANKEP